MGKIGNFFKKVWNKAKGVVGKIAGGISKIAPKIGGVIGKVGKATGIPILNWIGNAANAAGGVANTVSNLLNKKTKIKDALSDTIKTVSDVGKPPSLKESVDIGKNAGKAIIGKITGG